MGFIKNPFHTPARPPPPEFQTTKPRRPDHIEHVPSSRLNPGFGDDGARADEQPHYEEYALGTADEEINEDLVQVEGEDRMSPFVYLLLTAAGLSGFLFGLDTGIISGALVNIGTDLGHTLNATEKEWVTSATSVGALFGALLGGYTCDKLGRKWTLGVGDVFFTIGAVLIAASYSVPQIIVGRWVLGLGVGIAACITPIYIGELAPSNLRGRLVSVQSCAITIGQVVAYALGAGFTFRGGWRALFAVSIVPAAVQAIFIHWLPESPRYDLLKHKVDDAHKTLSVVYPDASADEIDLKIRVMQANVTHVQAFKKKTPFKQIPRLFFSRGAYRRALAAACGMAFFQQFAGFNTLLYYSPTIFGYAGFDNETATGLILAATNFCGTLLSMFSMDRVGKRRLLLLTYPVMILGLALTAVAFYKMTQPSNGVLSDEFASLYAHKWSSMMIGMMVIFVLSYATGIGNLAWHVQEFFPLEIRGYGTSIATSVVWASNIVVSASFLTMIEHIGAVATFSYYAGWCALGLLFISFCYPETKQLSLEECARIFDHGFGIKEANRMRADKAQLSRDRKDMIEKEMGCAGSKDAAAAAK